MKRMTVLFGQKRVTILLTLAIIALAVGAVIASGANFTSTSANDDNMFTAGALSMTNGGLTFDSGAMMPGDSKTGSVTLTNSSVGSAEFYLSASDITNGYTGTGTANLSDTLMLVVTDDAIPANTVFSGHLDDASLASGIDAGSFAAGASHTYTFVVTFPDSDASGSSKGSDNIYQGCTTSVDFDWEGVSD